MTSLAKASKILKGKIDLVPAILNYALNFSIADAKVDAKDFQIIYEYLQDNQEEKLGPFVFKNLLILKSAITKLADTLHEQLADNFEIRCDFNDVDQSMIEINVYKKIPLVEKLKIVFSNYIDLKGLEIKNVANLLNLITEESKDVPRGIHCNQILLETTLNFFSIFTQADANDFHIIYQHLQDNHEEKTGPFVFKNTLVLKSDISKLTYTLHDRLANNYHLVYRFSDGDSFSTEISVYKEDSLLERFKHFFETIQPGSMVAFVTSGPFSCSNILIFIKLLARLLGREEPINAFSDPSKVDSWLLFNGYEHFFGFDLFSNSEHFGTKKTKFIIELSYGRPYHNGSQWTDGSIPTLAANALSKYTCIESLDVKNIVDLIAEKSKNVPEGFNCNQIMVDNALNFSSKFTQANAKDFHIIFQHLHDNHEEKRGQFVFKNSLIPKSDFSSFTSNVYEELADIYEIRCGFSDVDPSVIEISVSKKMSILERLKNSLSKYTCLQGLEIKTIPDLLNLIPEESKFLPGGINCIQTMLDNALNFSSEYTKAESDDFHTIYQYLQDSHQAKSGSLIFKNSLTPKSKISKLARTLDVHLADNYNLVYEFSDCVPFSIEISVSEVSLIENFKNFFESIPAGSNVAFVASGSIASYDIFAFIRFVVGLLGRGEPIDAQSNSNKVNSWLSFDRQESKDLVTKSDDFRTKETKFVIELSKERMLELPENASSKYTFVRFTSWDIDLFVNILESMEDQKCHTILSRILNQVGKDPLCLQNLIGTYEL